VKHLKTFESSTSWNNHGAEVNDILNIARDEGLFVATPKIGRELEWGVTDETYYILRYSEEEDNNNNYENPIISTQEFVTIIENIIQRLELLGVIIDGIRPTYYRHSESFGRTSNNTHTSFIGDKLIEKDFEAEPNIIYATFTLTE
jgi:hypothetical protein